MTGLESPQPTVYRRRSRFAVYFTTRGWIHALLLLGVWLFVFPFIWMFGTSIKTDEELIDGRLLPTIELFQPNGPYVRRVTEPTKPGDVSTAQWKQMLPKLTDIASAAVATYQTAHPAEPSVAPLDADAHRKSAASALMKVAVGKIDRRLWAAPDQQLIEEYRRFLTPAAVQSALTDSLARLELASFQIRTLDLHNYVINEGHFAESWRVESGDAKLFDTGNSTRVSYHFDSSSAEPVVLRTEFNLPVGVSPNDLHKLTVSMQPDNSWHRITATLDISGSRWETQEANYIAQHRPTAFVFQPPTYEDELLRAKTWTTLTKIGPAPTTSTAPTGLAASAASGVPATFRLIITPSSTLRANLGKIWRNYDRAFKSVPFWKYMGNSMLLVVLCTTGSLFSATFVAYAFARLYWPGRSIAFVLVLSTMMLPSQVTMIPAFMIWRSLGWYNTLNPLWVPSFFGSAFFIFLMTQHMRTIPKDLEEAARIDGLNALQSWYYIIVPNVGPTLAAIAILSFMGAWNEFMGPLIYLRDQSRFPLSLGLYGLGLIRTTTPGTDFGWTVVMAGNMLMTIPVIAVFFLFQRYFVQGVTLTGMKG